MLTYKIYYVCDNIIFIVKISGRIVYFRFCDRSSLLTAETGQMVMKVATDAAFLLDIFVYWTEIHALQTETNGISVRSHSSIGNLIDILTRFINLFSVGECISMELSYHEIRVFKRSNNCESICLAKFREIHVVFIDRIWSQIRWMSDRNVDVFKILQACNNKRMVNNNNIRRKHKQAFNK